MDHRWDKYANALMRNTSESMPFPVSFISHNHRMLPAPTPRKRERPRGLWKARVMPHRLPAPNDHERKPFGEDFECDDDDDDAAASLPSSSSSQRSVSLEALSDIDKVFYFRGCSPNPDRTSNWESSHKIMDVSSIGGPGNPPENSSWTYEDWEDLKDLFIQASDQFESVCISVTDVEYWLNGRLCRRQCRRSTSHHPRRHPRVS